MKMKNVKYALPPDDVKLKSIGEVIKENSEYKDLIISVLENLGDLEDESIYYDIDNIKNNGAGGGYGNYIYYSDIINWLSNSNLQKEIIHYFKNWANDVYQISADDSGYLLDHMVLDLKLTDEEMENYFDAKIFKETYLVCRDSPYFKNYDYKDLLKSAYSIYLYMNNYKIPDLDLSGQEATFISWFVLEGVCYMFDK